MRVTLTAVPRQTKREISTPGRHSYEWVVTFQIDSDESLSFAVSIHTPASTSIEARAKALPKLQQFLREAVRAAQDFKP
jgi:hypothetical protein